MKIVFLRHATRSTQGLGDSALNQTGLIQAANLPDLLVPRGPLPLPLQLYSSPRKRAQQTLGPLAAHTQVPIEVDMRLDERQQNESATDFEKRVLAMIGLLEDLATAAPENSTGAIYVCTHLDWLEAGMQLLHSDMRDTEIYHNWSAAEFRIFKVHEGLWQSKERGLTPTHQI
jgi:phosphohistidine phosphatase SixA